MHRPLLLVAGTAAATLLVAGPAAAHVSATPSEAAAGGYARFAFRVPHGCDGAATTEVSMQIPDGVTSVTPEFVVGWDVATEVGPYDEPVELHGEEVTEGVQTVTWTAQDGFALPDDQFREFGLSVRLPDQADGDVMYFPTVQGCEGGAETAWIEIPSGSEEPEYPAPAVTLTAATGGHGHDASSEDAGEHTSEDTSESAGDTADTTDTTAGEAALAAPADEGTDPLTIAALVVGLLGLGAGAAGLAAARRAR